MTTYTGTAANDTITGGEGNDRITGKGGRDVLFGLGGDDYFSCTVFAGGDVIDGGTGYDTAEFSNRGWPDYRDRFEVHHATLDLIAGTVALGDDIHTLTNVEYVLGTGNPDLASTVDASRATVAVRVNLGTGEVVAPGSAIVKVSRFEDVTGGRAADTLTGDARPNTLDGRTGADTLSGGGDGDAYLVDNVADRVLELATDTGNDLILSAVNLALPENVERLVLAGAATVATGNTGGNSLIGNSPASTLNGAAGNDVLWGRGGNDRLAGGTGNDFLAGGDGADRYTYAAGDGADVISDASGTDTLTITGAAGVIYTGLDTARDGDRFVDSLLITLPGGGSVLVLDYFDNVHRNPALCNAGTGALEAIILGTERLAFSAVRSASVLVDTASAAAVTAAGRAYDLDNGVTKWAPTIATTTGDDTIIGLATGDVIDGGAGNDKLRAQVGNDTLTGGAGDDTLHGGNGHDVLLGGAGNDFLVGGYGADIVAGGAGDDTYNVADAFDTLIEHAGGGRDLVYVYSGFTLGDHFEDLSLVGDGGAGATLTGNAASNRLTGNSTANVLSGLAGNDTLVGGLGADTFDGGAGNDLFAFGTAADLAGDVIFGFDATSDRLALSALGLSVTLTDTAGGTLVTIDGASLLLASVHLTSSDWVV